MSRRVGTVGHVLLSCFLVLVVGHGSDAWPQAGEVPFTRLTIDARPPANPWFKIAGDLNGDGRLDLVVGGSKGPLVWYAAPGWTKAEIAAGGWDGVNGEAGDVDGDGDVDLVLGGVVWFENPGARGGAWAMHRIDTLRAHDIELADLDRDGRLDVVARDQSAFGRSGNALYLYRQVSPKAWTKRVIACPHGEGLKVCDLDRDGDPDIVIPGRWFENPGDPIAGPWKEHTYTESWQDPDAKVEAADLDGDGRRDIVLTPAELAGETHKIAWYQSPADPRAGAWTEHVIVPSIESVIHSLGAGDFDRDGRIDVAIAEMHQGKDPDEVCIYFNRGGGKSWRKQALSYRGSHDLVVADLDGDGDLDIVGANHGGPYQAVELWRNDLRM